MTVIAAVLMTFAAIFLDQALRRHRLPNHDFILNIEMLDPSIYDATGRRLLIPALMAAVGTVIMWFAVVLR